MEKRKEGRKGGRKEGRKERRKEGRSKEDGWINYSVSALTEKELMVFLSDNSLNF